MARKDVKALQKVADEAKKIRCRYCDIYNECSHRATKEAYEEAGWMTRCSITPNASKKKRKKK